MLSGTSVRCNSHITMRFCLPQRSQRPQRQRSRPIKQREGDHPMPRVLDHRDPMVAEQIYWLQQAAYAVERDVIGYADFPPLSVTAQDIQQEPEVFVGYWEGATLAGVISF